MIVMPSAHPGSVVLALQVIVVGAFGLCAGLSAMTTEECERLLVAAFLDAMAVAQLTTTQMAAAMGIHESLLRRQLAREDPNAHLSLFRLLRAPAVWWAHFGPALLYILWRREWQTVVEDAPVVESRRRL